MASRLIAQDKDSRSYANPEQEVTPLDKSEDLEPSIPKTPGELRQTLSNPIEEIGASPEEQRFEEVRAYNPETDTYEKKLVPVGESQAYEPADTGALDILDTSTYPQDLHYYWCNKDPKHQSEARRRGYAPVRESNDNAHPVLNVPGNGTVVTMGDLVLFGIPREFYEKRQYREERQAAKEEADRLRGITDSVKNITDDMGITLYGEGLTRSAEQYDLYEEDENADDFPADFATAAARSFEQAATAAGMDGGRAVYAGFNGPMGKGIPESPINRSPRRR